MTRETSEKKGKMIGKCHVCSSSIPGGRPLEDSTHAWRPAAHHSTQDNKGETATREWKRRLDDQTVTRESKELQRKGEYKEGEKKRGVKRAAARGHCGASLALAHTQGHSGLASRLSRLERRLVERHRSRRQLTAELCSKDLLPYFIHGHVRVLKTYSNTVMMICLASFRSNHMLYALLTQIMI